MTALTSESIKLKIKEIILNELDANINSSDITDDISLYDDGLGLDSISIINLIVLVEKKFGISFEENEISSTLFGSIHNLAETIYSKLNTSVESPQA
jgi:acyl carrier protein